MKKVICSILFASILIVVFSNNAAAAVGKVKRIVPQYDDNIYFQLHDDPYNDEYGTYRDGLVLMLYINNHPCYSVKHATKSQN